ncbi:MAG: thioredoxin domain-containing protein [Bacteroidota bacterium]
MKYICIILLSFFVAHSSYAQPKGEFKKLYKNGRVYQESKKLQVLKGLGFTLNTYYDNGEIMRQEEWANGKRNGLTKIFLKNNQLVKEARFRDDYLLEYTAFKNNQPYTKISADRRTIINKGRLITPRWDKYYEMRGSNRLLVFDKKQLVDWMSGWMIPEEVTQIMEDLATYYDSQTKAGGADDMVTCGGSTSIMNDLGADMTSLGSGAGSGKTTSRTSMGSSQQNNKRTTALEAVGAIANTCAGTSKANLAGGSGGIAGMNASRNKKVNKARATMANAIAECQSGNRGGNGMFAMDIGGIFKGAAFVEEMILAEAAEAGTMVTTAVEATEGAAIIDATIVDGLATGATTETAAASVARGAAVNAVRGFILADVAVAATGVTVAAGVGWAIGTWFNETAAGKALTAAIAEAQESGDAALQKAIADAAAAQAAAEEKRAKEENAKKEEDKKKEDDKTKTGGSTPKTPLPDGIGSGDPCERMKAFNRYCESTDWKDMRCENFVRLVNGCKGNITQMYVAGDGNVMDVGCPGGGTDQEKRAQQAAIDCQKRGMISQPGGDGISPCRSGNIDRAIPGGNNPLVTDPVRGEFSDAFSNTAVKVISANELGAALNSAKPTMIVFMDPDCSSCKDFNRTLKDPSMAASYAGMDVRVVDASQSPDLLQQYNIQYFPSYFVAKSGKKTDMSIGAMKPADLKKFMTDNTNGMK